MTEKIEGFSAVQADTGKKIELAMQDLRLEGTLTEVGATLKVRHLFKSAEKQVIEAVYAFMLPRDAALRSFKIVGENFNVSSKLLKTSEAKKVYEEGIDDGSLSVLTQQYRDGVVNLSIGNLRPDETVAVYLEIIAGVDIRDDGFRFRFPFTIAPGYHPKARYSINDEKGEVTLPEDDFGDVIYPEWWKDSSNLHSVNFNLLVSTENKIRSISSPSHPIEVSMDERIQVKLSTMKDVPNKDLVLDAKTEIIEPRTLTSQGEENLFMTVIPSTCFNEKDETPRRIVFLVDRSGSMRGAAMEQAKNALRACLGALSSEDQFSIISFDNRVEVFNQSMVKGVLGHREKASEFIQQITARGGTELFMGIEAAVNILEGKGDILILTDGQVLASEDVINNIIHENIRLHCLGIGSASQDRFLTLLSRKTGGISSFVTPRERVDLAALKLFASIKNPVAENVKIKLRGGKIYTTPPTTVYPGKPLTIMGTLKKTSELEIDWKNSDQKLSIPLKLDSNIEYESLNQIQGSRILTDLDSQISTRNPRDKRKRSRIMRKLLETSRKYGLASRAASLVAVVKRQDDVSGIIPQIVVVPVGVPQDLDFNSYRRPRRGVRRRGLPRAPVTETLMASPTSGLESTVKDERMKIREPEKQVTESDLLIEYASMIQPDGGMPGNNTEERLLNSTILYLWIKQQPEDVAEAFSVHLERLVKYIEAHKTKLTQEKTSRITKILNQDEKITGPWNEYLSYLTTKRQQTDKEEIWKNLMGNQIT